MSFILDALKKSESDRQRQSGPALFEVKVPPRRRSLPPWGIALAVLLAVNLLIVAWLLLRRAPTHAEPAAASTAATAPLAPPVPPPATPAPAPTSVSAPAAHELPATAGTPAPALAADVPAAGAAHSDELNPEDYAPAADAPPALNGHVRRGTADGVPLYQDVAAAQGSRVPQLRLDLHVYAAQPQERFVMINMHKLREGDSLPEGVRLESVTPEGAVLSYGGARFLLPRD